MSLYSIAVFLHVVGALGLFAALGLEWAGLRNLRRAVSIGQVREWTGLLAAIRSVGGPAGLLLLVTGLYLTATRWGHQAWIGLGLLGLLLIAGLGAVLTGRRVGAIARAIPPEEGPAPPALRRLLRDPALTRSAWLRTCLALGVVFLMSVKPGTAGAVASLALALALGLGTGWLAATGGRRPVPVESHPGES